MSAAARVSHIFSELHFSRCLWFLPFCIFLQTSLNLHKRLPIFFVLSFKDITISPFSPFSLFTLFLSRSLSHIHPKWTLPLSTSLSPSLFSPTAPHPPTYLHTISAMQHALQAVTAGWGLGLQKEALLCFLHALTLLIKQASSTTTTTPVSWLSFLSNLAFPKGPGGAAAFCI